MYYQGFNSRKFRQTSGVQQGSVLGPLLFNIYIDDVGQQIDVEYLMYADDLKLICEVKTIDDCVRLQNNLNRLYNWSVSNELLLNKDKCFVKSYFRKVKFLFYNYTIDDSILERPEYICDLGVTFDRKLKFDKHIENVSALAYRSLGLVIRNSSAIQDKEVLSLLFFTYVRSRLEYSSVVWSPIYNCHISALEKVQRRFLKFLSFLDDGVYPPRGIPNDVYLKRFKIQSLLCRRNIASLMLLHNIIHSVVDCEDILNLLYFKACGTNLRFSSVLEAPRPKTNGTKASPLYQMIRNYMQIENEVDIFNCTTRDIKICYKL